MCRTVIDRDLCLGDGAQAGEQALLDYGNDWWNDMIAASNRAKALHAKDDKIRQQAQQITELQYTLQASNVLLNHILLHHLC